jgi:hypothetical protein
MTSLAARTAVFALALVVVSVAHAVAADAPVVNGNVKQPLALTSDMLRSLPKTDVDVSFETSKGRETVHYAGALLWAILDKAGLVNGDGKNAELRHTLLITGRDGYAVAIAVGEIEPHYEAKPVIIAYEGGTPSGTLAAIRLIVPGDAHGGRSVSNVVHIEVR